MQILDYILCGCMISKNTYPWHLMNNGSTIAFLGDRKYFYFVYLCKWKETVGNIRVASEKFAHTCIRRVTQYNLAFCFEKIIGLSGIRTHAHSTTIDATLTDWASRADILMYFSSIYWILNVSRHNNDQLSTLR